MKASIHCPHCNSAQSFSLAAPRACSACGKDMLPHATRTVNDNPPRFEQCPVCGCAHLYRKKDFNQKLGIALVAVGVVFSFFTYGLSLLAVTLIDWWLYRRVGEVASCYHCEAEFRGDGVDKVEPFQLVLHDHYRAVKANRS